MIWTWNLVNNSVECVYVCEGHSKPLEALDVSNDKRLMATGGWDTTLKIWSTCKLKFLKFIIFTQITLNIYK